METAELLAGRYRLGPVLGRGGMGAVYRAHDELLGRDVAVKLLDVEQALDAAVQRFRREAQFLAGLAHPNVVTVFDFGTDEQRAWLVMEMLAGPTLQDLVNERGPLPIVDVTRYGRECAAALAAAHAAGITHRDVKPANVMLSADGTCKLLDLGIARLDGAATTQPALTQAGTILGTVPYLAPEVITGAAPQPPADMYALGGVLFALLTARPPFQGEDLMAAMAQHVHAPAPRPSAERGDVPLPLDDLVVALLAKDPARRPTATAVLAALDGSPAAALAKTVALAGAVPATTQVIDAPMQHRSRNALIGVAVVLAVALLAVVLVIANGGNDTTGRNALRTGSSKSPSKSPSKPPSKSANSSTRTKASPSPRSRSPRPTTMSGALTALQSAITSAQANGGLSAHDAQDLFQRVNDMRAAPAGSGGGPGKDPGKGNGKGKDHGKGNGGDGGTPDITPMLDDFAHHLDDLQHKGAISGPAYSSIASALGVVRSFAGGGGD